MYYKIVEYKNDNYYSIFPNFAIIVKIFAMRYKTVFTDLIVKYKINEFVQANNNDLKHLYVFTSKRAAEMFINNMRENDLTNKFALFTCEIEADPSEEVDALNVLKVKKIKLKERIKYV